MCFISKQLFGEVKKMKEMKGEVVELWEEVEKEMSEEEVVCSVIKGRSVWNGEMKMGYKKYIWEGEMLKGDVV